MSVRTLRRKDRRLLLLLILIVMTALSVALMVGVSRASAQGAEIGMVCQSGDTFNLKATQGYISTPDGNSVYMWGYALSNGQFQMPGPILCVEEGDLVTINLTNELPEPVSIIFPGQQGVTTSGGSAGLFTAEAAASGGMVTYTFVASEPGTYLYESGTSPHKQVQMGLYGALIVRPSLGPNYAYNDESTEFNEEYIILLHDIDPFLHDAVEHGLPYDITTMHDRYWTINGRSMPDTLAPNFVPWLPSQPYGALVKVEATSPDNLNPEELDFHAPALIRYANAGMVNHPYHPHGNNLRIIARDGRLLVDPSSGEVTSFEAFSRTIGSGETYDLLFHWINTDGWTSSGNPIPVTIPGLQNQVFKDDLTFFSSSPYLGEQGELPVGVTSFNECGEFYFPWHSHALNEFQNFDEGFGGMATLARIDPPGGCQ